MIIPVALTLTEQVFHCNEVVPKSLVPLVEGTKSVSNLPVAPKTSLEELPKIHFHLMLNYHLHEDFL